MRHTLEAREAWQRFACTTAIALASILVILTGGCGDDPPNGPEAARIIIVQESLHFDSSNTTHSVALRNEGDKDGSCTVISRDDWCTLSTVPGTVSPGASGSVVINATASCDGHSAGTDTTWLVVFTDGQPTDSCLVVLLCPSAARVVALVGSLDFGTSETSLTDTLKNVGNTAGGFTLVESANWLSLGSTSGSLNPATRIVVTASVNRTLLNQGENRATIIVNTQGTPTDTIHVRALKFCLSVGPARIDFGNSRRQSTLSIRSTCPGTLLWDATPDQSWITLTRLGDTALAVAVARSLLPAPGAYTGSVTVSAGAEVVTVPVTAVLDPNPVVSVDRPALDFQTDKDSLRILLSNEGGGPLTWSTRSDSSWVHASPTAGTLPRTNQMYISIWIDRSRMNCGRNDAVIEVTSNGPPISVELTANGYCFDLQGIVSDVGSGIGIDNALVEVLNTGLSDLTDDTGAYLIRGVPAGTQTVRATKTCFTFAQTSVSGPPGTTVTRDLGLQYSGPDGTCLYYQDFPISSVLGPGAGLKKWEIYQPDAANIMIHFAALNLGPNWWCATYVRVTDASSGTKIWEQCSDANYERHLSDVWTTWCNTNHVYIEAMAVNWLNFTVDKYTYYK